MSEPYETVYTNDAVGLFEERAGLDVVQEVLPGALPSTVGLETGRIGTGIRYAAPTATRNCF